MPVRRWPRRTFAGPGRALALRRLALILLALVIAGAAVLSAMLRDMVSDYAVSAARDLVVSRVNEIVKSVMADPAFAGQELVTLQRDQNGEITAVSANVTAVNTLAAEVLSRAVEGTEREKLTVEIPLSNLFGSALLMNRGPAVKVRVIMLSSSTADFRSQMTSAGINQTRHQLFLDLDIQMSFLLPWKGMDTSVQTEILVSETVIVGRVPESYMNWER